MPTVYVLSGPAGVGKSTTSRTLVNALENSAYISGDDISHIFFKKRGSFHFIKTYIKNNHQ